MMQRYEIFTSTPRAEKVKLESVDIMASVGHEIRNPLNAIIGLSHLLHSANSLEEVKNYTEGLMQTSGNLMEMVNNLMDFSKLRSGKPEINLKPVALQESLVSQMSGHRLMAEGKGLDFILDIDRAIPRALVLDPVKLGQVLLNLVSNSIKFTSTGYVRVQVSLMRKTNSEIQLLFSVEDTGRGISEEHLEKIFNAFNQGDQDTNVNFGGTGLGLSISKQLVEVMGGSLVVESEPGNGSKFSFILTALILQQEEIKPREPISCRPLTGLRILVVDDSKINLMIVGKFLESKNMLYTSAANGTAALELLTQQDFDIILTDLIMPQIDGYELLRSLRESEDLKRRNMPVIAITGSLNGREGEDLIKLGFSDHLLKPFRAEELFGMLLKHVQLR